MSGADGDGAEATALERMKAHSSSTLKRLRDVSAPRGAQEQPQQPQQHRETQRQSAHLREQAEARAHRLAESELLKLHASSSATRHKPGESSSSSSSSSDNLREDLSLSQEQLAQAQADLRSQVRPRFKIFAWKRHLNH
jgi:hypothetical protein